MKKKTRNIILFLVLIIIVVFILNLFASIKNLPAAEQKSDQQIASSDGQSPPQYRNEMIFIGKVLPASIQEVYLDTGKTLAEVLVKEGDTVGSSDRLLTFYGADIVKEKIKILENSFVFFKEEQNWFDSRIKEIEQEISWNNDTLYLQALNKELSEYKQKLAENRISWLTAENELEILKKSLTDYTISAEFAGFVYELNTSTFTNAPYLTLYSKARVIRIEVGEYELEYLVAGMEVTVEIEGLDIEFTGKILDIASLPNNMDSVNTSYYNVSISIEQEVPFGYSAIVRIAL